MQYESISDSEYKSESDDCLMFLDRIYLSKNLELIQKILHEHIVVAYLYTQEYQNVQ